MQKDLEILRNLASELAEIAALPVQQETKRLWRKLNHLNPERPMVMIDQIPWHEMNVNDELTLLCQDEWNRQLETGMRQTLYRWRHMRGDLVIDDFVFIPAAVEGYGFNMAPQVTRLQYDELNTSATSQHYADILKTDEDAEQIKPGVITLNKEAQQIIDEKYHSIYDGILALRRGGCEPTYQLWDYVNMLHDIQETLIDLYDRPEFAHKIMSKFRDAALSMLTQLEEQGLLLEHQSIIHCTGAYYDWNDVPTEPGKTSAKNAWTLGMSQFFSTVSPEMHEEFELPYLKPLFERFGNVYYGCCEPLHLKVDMIRKYPNVRKISMSPWADAEIGSAKIGRDYVFSNKPNPAFVAKTTLDEEEVRNDLQHTYDVCRKNGTPLEFILKDISTVCYDPSRLWKWADVAMRVAKQ